MFRSRVVSPLRPTSTNRPNRPRRRRGSHLAAAALVATAWVGPTVAPVQAQDGFPYQACVESVREWTQECYSDHNIVGDIGCFVGGMLGTIGCIVGEVIEQISRGIVLQP